MKKLLLLLLFLTTPALADMYQDASNAKLPNARAGLGMGPAASIMDYPGADPTGATSSDAAFQSCITSGKDCRVPAGTYLLACSAHTAVAGAAVIGDGAKASVLKLPPACTIGPWSVLQASQVRDLTVDVNNTTSAGAVVVALHPGVQPKAERIHVVNGTTGMHLVGLVTAGVNTTDPVVSHNYLHLTAPGTSGNHCVLFSGSGGGTITGGSIDNNVCVNTGMIVRANSLSITDNDISGWNYGTAIALTADPDSAKFLIARNRFHDSGTLLDSDVTAASAVENWAPDTVIVDNHCWNLGGGCIMNGGLRALVANNHARGMNKHNFPAGLGAFSSMVSGSYRADGSLYTGNRVVGDGSAIPVWGYQEQAGAFQGITVSGNDFSGATSGRVDPANLSPATKIDAMSKSGSPSGEGLIATKSTTGTGVASFEFTSLDTTNYGAFKLMCSGIQLGAGAANIGLQVGEGAGPTWVTAGYGAALVGAVTGSATALVRTSGGMAYIPFNITPLSPLSAILAHFEAGFGDLARPGFSKSVKVSGSYVATPPSTESASGGGNFGSYNPITAVRVVTVGGNIDYGTCRLYGLI